LVSLSEDLLINFAKSMKTEEAAKDVTLFGTVKSVQDGTSAIVNIDGSTADTKAILFVRASVGDRVTVLLKDHKAIVTGNVTNSMGIVKEDSVSLYGITLILNKCERIVTIRSSGSNTEAIPNGSFSVNNLIPEEFRPYTNYIVNPITQASGSGGAGLLIDILQDGTVACYNFGSEIAAGGELWFSCTYISLN